MTAFSFANQKYIRVAVAAVLAIFMAGIFLQNAAPALGAEPVAFSGDISITGDHYGIINGDQVYSNRWDPNGPGYNFLCAYDLGEDAQISLGGEWGGCQNTYDDFWVQDLVGVGSQLYILADDLTSEEDTGPGYHLFAWNGGAYWDDAVLFTLSEPAKLYEADGTIFALTDNFIRRYNTAGDVLAATSFSGDLLSVSAVGNTFWLNTTAGVHEYTSGSFVRTLAPYTDAGEDWYLDSLVVGDNIWISATDASNGAQIGEARLYALDLASGAVVYEIDDFGRDASNNEWDFISSLASAGNRVYAAGEDFILNVNSDTGIVRNTVATDLDVLGDINLSFGDYGRLMLFPVKPTDGSPDDIKGWYGAAYYSSLQFGNARFDAEGFIVDSETLFDGEAWPGTGATIDTWSWDFGDDETASGEDVSHTYTEAGTFNVRLTVEMADGSRAFAEQEIDIAPTLPNTYDPLPPLPPLPDAPEINFNVEPVAGEAPLDVFFYSDTSAGGEPEIWAWDFGDGGTSDVANPVHTYTDPGTYTVSLTVTNAAGSDTETKVDVVHAQSLPVAAFSATPLGGTTPLEVTFTNTSTNAISYSWDFGDGNTSTTASPVHTYIAAGTYTVSLTATNTDGDDVETKTDYITVENSSAMPDVTGRIITQNSFNSEADANAYAGELTNGYMVNNHIANSLRFTPRHLVTATPTVITPVDAYYRASGSGSVRVCSTNYAISTTAACTAWAPAGASLGSVNQVTHSMRATDAWVWFEFLGSVTYDDLMIVDPNANVGTATASEVTAELSYHQASTDRTVWPFKSGPLTITATFSEAPANTPTINLDQFGTTDIANVAMTASADPAVWTYDYNIMTQTGTAVSSTYRDGVIRATINALDGNGVAVNPATNAFFTNDTLLPTAPTFASGSMGTFTTNPNPLIKTGGTNHYLDTLYVYEGGTNLISTRDSGTQNGTYGTQFPNSEGFTVGPYADGTYNFTMRNIDVAGNVGPLSAVKTTTIDTIAPTPPSAPDLLNDSGIPDDNITNAVPMLFGGTATPNTIVELYYSGTYLGQSTSDGSGNWTISVGSAWGGQLPFNARTRDAAGNLSAPSEFLYVTFYDAKPPVDAPVLDPASDSGTVGDFITNDSTPTFTVSENSIGDGIALYLDGVLIDSAPDSATDNSSSLTTTLGPLADGTYVVQARTVDFVNNIGTANVNLVVQTVAPSGTPGAPVLDPASDTGALGDSLTSDNTPILSGDGALSLPGSVVTTGLLPAPVEGGTLSSGEYVYSYWNTGDPYTLTDGNATTYAKLSYSQPQAIVYNLGQPISLGSASVKIDDTNGAGTSTMMRLEASTSASGPWTVIYTETVAVGPGLRTLNIDEANAGPWQYVRFINTYSSASSTNRRYMRWYEAQLTSVPIGLPVGIFDGDTLLGTATSQDGDYSLTMPSMDDGDYNLTARSMDAAGNLSSASDALPLSIDATAPVTSVTSQGTQSSLTFNVSYAAADAHDISQVQLFYSADSGAALGDFTEFGSGFTASPISFTAPSEGTYRFYTIGTDELGNVEAIPASADAQIDVTSAGGPPPPPDNGDMSIDIDGDTSWTTNTNVYSDPSAPSGDGEIVRLSAPDGETANGFSESYYVEPGQTVTVTGFWRLSGHGSTLTMCFDNGECPESESLGELGGSTIYNIDWTPFTLEAVVPDDSYWLYLDWIVGSDSEIDNLEFGFDTSDTSNTLVDVLATISVEAPALIDMGAGIPGDELTANADVTVSTNNEAGYDLQIAVSDMSAGAIDTIAATSLSRRNTDGGSFANFAGANTPLSLAASAARTDAAGDTVNLDLRVLLPFVDTGVYNGTATFTATTN